jgi:hypothetical protein
MASEAEEVLDSGLFGAEVSQEDVRRETRSREWADGARYIHWVGLTMLGAFLVGLINVLPPRVTDLTWQLNLIALLLGLGNTALLGALLICVARLFNPSDRQIQSRALLVRTLASWVALGWLLLIPLQVYLGVRLINTQAGQEIGQIKGIERISRAVRNATTEEELRRALALVPNQPPLPALTVPLEVAKSNLLAQFQKNINTLRNRQDDGSSARWQIWIKEAFRNSLQSALLGLGFLAIGKNRSLSPEVQTTSQRSRSRSRA